MTLSKRKRAFFDLVKRRGMTPSQASTVALARHPIDKISKWAAGSAAFKSEMLHRADQFDRDSRGAPGPEAERMALQALRDYCRIAGNHDQQYYVLRFCPESTNPAGSDNSD
jgi:hypothetical protein